MGDFQPDAQVKGCLGWSWIALICSSETANRRASSESRIIDQMYKVFIKEHVLVLSTQAPAQVRGFDTVHLLPYRNHHTLIQVVEDLMEREDQKPRCVALFGVQERQLWEACTKVFEIVDAGGGLVRHSKTGDLLFIFRHKKWDLPKGKTEKKETIEQTALREVQEECGLQALSLVRALCTTYHVFGSAESRKIKRSFWFLMETNQNELIPQIEEGITHIEWVPPQEVHKKLKKAYNSIYEVVQAYWHQAGWSAANHRFRLK